MKKDFLKKLSSVMKTREFKKESANADIRLKFSIAVYNGRKAKKLGQIALAKRVGTTQNIISRIENGDYETGIGLMNRICKALNITFLINQV